QAVRTDTPACNTGTLNCCQSTQPTGGISGLLGILTGNNCSPITAIGVGSGANCQQQTVCCTGNNQSGLIVLGCTPISLAL
ncbi:fungal hydrophobin, partial [Pholiota conissans]